MERKAFEGKPSVFRGQDYLVKARTKMYGRIENPEYEPQQFFDEDLNKLKGIEVPLSNDDEEIIMSREGWGYLVSLHCAYEKVRMTAKEVIKHRKRNMRSEKSERLLSGLVALLEIQI